MGSPFGSNVFSFPLHLDRRITLAFGFCSFRWAPGSGACACHLFLGWASSFALCSSSLCGFILICQFPFLGIFLDSTCWPFSPPFLLWLSLILVARCFLGPFLPLEFPLRFGWSSGRLVAFRVPLAWLPSLSGSDVPFPCLEFSATCLRVFRGYSTEFSFVRLCFPFFL